MEAIRVHEFGDADVISNRAGMLAPRANFPGSIEPSRAPHGTSGDKGMFKAICGKVRRCNRENPER